MPHFQLLVKLGLPSLRLTEAGTSRRVHARKCVALAPIETVERLATRTQRPARFIPKRVPVELFPLNGFTVSDLSARPSSMTVLAEAFPSEHVAPTLLLGDTVGWTNLKLTSRPSER